MPLALAAQLSIEVESGAGPWSWYLKHRGHSTTMQRFLLPWLIGLYGIGYSKLKAAKLQVPEMIVALCTEHKLLAEATSMQPFKAAELYGVAFADVCERAWNAACKPILLQYVSE